jgi:stearoyl-CoA 9-desaturase NADPH oxidoreductase
MGRVGSTARALVSRATTPLLPGDYLCLVNPLWSAREVRGRVLTVRPETADSATLVIRPGRGFGFDYAPGQHIGIGVAVDGRWRWRSYSLTSAPRSTARTVSIAVKAVPEGFVSGHLVRGLRPGTLVRLAAPRGDFVMPDPAPAKVLFLTAGSGVTPIVSMLRTLKRRNQIGDIVHLHSAPSAAEAMFAAELSALSASVPGYRLALRATRTEGRLELSDLDDAVPDWRERQTWVCGPAGLLDAAERHWAGAGLGDRLHCERFAAVRSARGAGGTVTFARSGRRRAVDAATTLLDAGEQAGVLMPFGCRMGICHTCMVTLADGRVRDLRTGAEHEPGSRVQTCISVADGDCVVDI